MKKPKAAMKKPATRSKGLRLNGHQAFKLKTADDVLELAEFGVNELVNNRGSARDHDQILGYCEAANTAIQAKLRKQHLEQRAEMLGGRLASPTIIDHDPPLKSN